eukprot:CFRG1812T1
MPTKKAKAKSGMVGVMSREHLHFNGVDEVNTKAKCSTVDEEEGKTLARRTTFWAIISATILLFAIAIAVFKKSTITFQQYDNEVMIRQQQLLQNLNELACGSSIDYWSDSCGPIISVMSRTCSRGGFLINEDSCTSHFEPESQGCGLMRLGCRSKCRALTKSCNQGAPRFMAATTTVLASDESFPVFVERVDGNDGPLGAVVNYCGGDDKSEHTIQWKDNDVDIKTVYLPNNELHVGESSEKAICLSTRSGSNSSAMLRLVDMIGDTILFANTTITGMESDKNIRIALHRVNYQAEEMKKLYRQTATALPAHLNVTIVRTGGTAMSSIDFEAIFPYEIIWAEEDDNTLEFLIPLLGKNSNLLNNTLNLQVRVNDRVVATSKHQSTVCQVNIINESSQKLFYRNQVYKFKKYQQLGDLIGLPRDLNIRHTFFKSFEVLHVPPNTHLFGKSKRIPGVVLVASGIVDVSNTLKDSLETGIDATVEEERSDLSGSDSDWRKYKRSSIHTKNAAGTLIGMSSFINTKSLLYQLSAIAKEESELWIATSSSIMHFARDYPEVAKSIVRKSIRTKMQNVPFKPPLLFFPGFMSSRLVAWKHKACPSLNIDPFDVMWVSVERIAQMTIADPRCFLDCLSLGPNQTDPHDCTVRAMDGIAALTELTPGLVTTPVTTIYGYLIRFFVSNFGYNAMHVMGMPYDWRLSPDQMDDRDGYWVSTKKRIEGVVHANKMPAIAVGHSQGNIVILHFMRWLEYNYPKTWKSWVKDHISSYYGLGAPLLGSIDPVRGLMVGSNMGMPFSNALARNMAMTFGTMPWFVPNIGNKTHVSGSSRVNEHRPSSKWVTPITTVIWANKSSTDYNWADLSSTKLHSDMRDSANDSRWQNQINIVNNNYKNKEFNQLADGYARPPIKHVYMMYGVDWDTPVQETYYAKEGPAEPILVQVNDESEGGSVKNRFTGEKVGDNGYKKSGDGTVPYVSLSWAHLWHHNTTKVETQTIPARVLEYYDHPIGKWGERTVFSLMNVNEPAYDIYHSQHIDKDNRSFFTSVYEIKGGGCGHRSIVKDDFIHKLIGQTILDDMRTDYTIMNTEEAQNERGIGDMSLRHDESTMNLDVYEDGG